MTSVAVPAETAAKLRRMMAAIHRSSAPDKHASAIRAGPRPPAALKGDLAGYWSLSITGNWRLIVRFEEGDAFDLDLVDYH